MSQPADLRDLRRRADNLLAVQTDGCALWTETEQIEAGDVMEALLAALARRGLRESETPDATADWQGRVSTLKETGQ